MKTVVSTAVALAAVSLLALAGSGMTADEILEQVERQGFLGLGTGDFQGEFALVVEEPGEELAEYGFRVWSRQEEDGTVKTTILYRYPELVAGTVFLFHSPPEGDPRLWLMLPEVGVVKELVGSGAEREFVAGVGVTYEEIAHGFTYREGYESDVVDEVTLEGVRCWKIRVIPTEAEEADWASIVLWVHQEKFVVMRAEFEDWDGEVNRRMRALELEEDELGYFPRVLAIEDLLDGVRAEIQIVERSRERVPEEVFAPERLLELGL